MPWVPSGLCGTGRRVLDALVGLRIVAEEHGSAGRDFGDVPVPLVRTPADYEPPMFDLATYGEIDREPGRYELEWFI